ncbi:MAG: hypothetical protein M3552_05725, partial [Planctomycetota bacterium]|nr:hypothetical protein [Planctomycetota bacterium]
LSAADPSLLERLPQPREATDPAARLALTRIRKRLQERQAAQDSSATLLNVGRLRTLADLANASGSAIEVAAEQASRRVSVPDGQRPFWEVVDAVAAQARLWPVVSEHVRFRERMPDDDAKSVAYSGTFRLIAEPLRFKEISGETDDQLARVALEVQSEPKLRPLFLSYAADEFFLTTAEGAKLQPFSPKARYELPFGEGGRTASLGLDFIAATPIASGSFILAGRMTVVVAAGKERFSFPFARSDDRRDETVRSQGGVTVRLRKVERHADGTAEVELSVVYDEGGPAFESHRTWVYHNLAYVTYAAAGEDGSPSVRLDHQPGFSTLANAAGGVILAYRFADIPPDARDVTFHYEAPTRIIDVPVEFEMGLRSEEGRTEEREK